MNILSYRGPSTAGGVSSALARIIETCTDGDPRWWYINENCVETRTSAFANADRVSRVPKHVIDGHYAYCNNFIWPILHDLPQHATFSARERRLYQQFNMRFARNIMRARQLTNESFFVNDYQLAIATGMIAKAPSSRIILFWHVPWPTEVLPEHAPYIAEVARGLIGSKRIGFHTEEYADNFLNFVAENIPGYLIDFRGRRIIDGGTGHATELVALPLGLDYRFWHDTAIDSTPVHKDMDMREQITGKFVLSVDRADYTKAVMERMEAIDNFFAANPHRIGDVTFVQLCQATRVGLPAFDKYWEQVRRRGHQINARYQRGNWKPVTWIDKPVPPKVLAWLYKKAEAMLINPVRDGLNLTAKEFAVCSNNGALILSRGAGVWHEIGDKVVPLASLDAGEIAEQIEASLKMPLEDRVLRLRAIKQTIAANSLRVWWRNFEMGTTSQTKVVPISTRAKKSEGGVGLLLAK